METVTPDKFHLQEAHLLLRSSQPYWLASRQMNLSTNYVEKCYLAFICKL